MKTQGLETIDIISGMLGLLLFAYVVFGTSGCMAGHAPSPWQEGSVMLAGDAEGVKAFFDGASGLITNGKASPDADTAHWQTRRAQEAERTRRAYAPGFFQKLFGGEQIVPQPARQLPEK